jgi:hypothetical protein
MEPPINPPSAPTGSEITHIRPHASIVHLGVTDVLTSFSHVVRLPSWSSTSTKNSYREGIDALSSQQDYEPATESCVSSPPEIGVTQESSWEIDSQSIADW